MESFFELLTEWEIQLLVVLSFTLQIFLFFTGGLRRCTSNTFLRLSVWISYLGADMIAVYALGFLSRNEDATTTINHALASTHQLAFLWAPFLLIHLGGQDTVTAFSIEDNKLWLRHLLNLIMQVSLSLYVFWKSIGRHNVQLLVPGIFMFVTGIIKYGERTLALMSGELKSSNNNVSTGEESDKKLAQLSQDHGYSGVVHFALHLAPGVRDLFSGRAMYQMQGGHSVTLEANKSLSEDKLPKLLEVELGLVYDDLYTKAAVLRKRSVIILRCISQVSATVGLVLFAISNKQRYNRVDVAITYILFGGGLFLEGCATFMMAMVSPWTWVWLDARGYRRFAGMSWFILASNFGYPENRPLWSNSMGQYSILSYMGVEQSRLSKLGMTVVRKITSIVGVRKEKFLWISKLLDSKNIEVDKKVMESMVQGVDLLNRQIESGAPLKVHEWPNLGALFQRIEWPAASLGYAIVKLHVFTELHLSKYDQIHSPPLDMDAEVAETGTCGESVDVTADVCRKLSNYMLYLLVAHSSMLPVVGVSEDTLEIILKEGFLTDNGDKDAILHRASEGFEEQWEVPEPQPRRETLEEIKGMWVHHGCLHACHMVTC